MTVQNFYLFARYVVASKSSFKNFAFILLSQLIFTKQKPLTIWPDVSFWSQA